jgi:hypothetical protein
MTFSLSFHEHEQRKLPLVFQQQRQFPYLLLLALFLQSKISARKEKGK